MYSTVRPSTRMQPRDLTGVLKDETPGEWVALSMDEKRILGRGKTPEEAKEAATQAGEKQDRKSVV